MKIQRPYIIETNNIIEVSSGGSYEPNKLTRNKRQKIKNFSRASQRRLLEKIESAQKFKPTMILKVTFPDNVNIRETNMMLILYFISLKKYFIQVIKKLPLIFWRKNFSDDQFYVTLLLNFPVKYNVEKFMFIMNLYWKIRVGKKSSIEIERFDSNMNIETIKSFCFDNTQTVRTDVGRWWGVVYSGEYKFKKLKRQYCSLEEIKEIVKDLDKIESGKIKRNVYQKQKIENKPKDTPEEPFSIFD